MHSEELRREARPHTTPDDCRDYHNTVLHCIVRIIYYHVGKWMEDARSSTLAINEPHVNEYNSKLLKGDDAKSAESLP